MYLKRDCLVNPIFRVTVVLHNVRMWFLKISFSKSSFEVTNKVTTVEYPKIYRPYFDSYLSESALKFKNLAKSII